MNKIENILMDEKIGAVRYVRNSRAKNLSIRINRQGEVRVTLPRFVSRRRADAFLELKKAWILKRLREIRAKQQENSMPVEGDWITVRRKKIPIQLKHGAATVEDAIWGILLREAKAYLPGRVRELAGQHGFRYRDVKIRKMKSRWGSCSGKNNINLNSWLMMLPDHLCDYVILHELVHTGHRDHSERFWKALDQVTVGRSKDLRKELRKQQIMYFHSGVEVV